MQMDSNRAFEFKKKSGNNEGWYPICW